MNHSELQKKLAHALGLTEANAQKALPLWIKQQKQQGCGYKPNSVRKTLQAWRHRTDGRPGRQRAEILEALSYTIGEPVSPALDYLVPILAQKQGEKKMQAPTTHCHGCGAEVKAERQTRCPHCGNWKCEHCDAGNDMPCRLCEISEI